MACGWGSAIWDGGYNGLGGRTWALLFSSPFVFRTPHPLPSSGHGRSGPCFVLEWVGGFVNPGDRAVGGRLLWTRRHRFRGVSSLNRWAGLVVVDAGSARVLEPGRLLSFGFAGAGDVAVGGRLLGGHGGVCCRRKRRWRGRLSGCSSGAAFSGGWAGAYSPGNRRCHRWGLLLITLGRRDLCVQVVSESDEGRGRTSWGGFYSPGLGSLAFVRSRSFVRVRQRG